MQIATHSEKVNAPRPSGGIPGSNERLKSTFVRTPSFVAESNWTNHSDTRSICIGCQATSTAAETSLRMRQPHKPLQPLRPLVQGQASQNIRAWLPWYWCAQRLLDPWMLQHSVDIPSFLLVDDQHPLHQVASSRGQPIPRFVRLVESTSLYSLDNDRLFLPLPAPPKRVSPSEEDVQRNPAAPDISLAGCTAACVDFRGCVAQSSCIGQAPRVRRRQNISSTKIA
mmetsp:Transcript_58138/g.134144  ORF Transcript_58138/g.134144 Transcript_58138/m.134144 type:complete len:226 (+) Transcript_58138:261-938(+)